MNASMKIQSYAILSVACSALLVLVASANPACGGLLYEESVKTNLHGIYSNEQGQEVAVPFSIPPRATITHLTWYGFWWGSETRSREAATRLPRFNVRVFADSSGGPGDTPLFDQTVTARVQPTGQKMYLPGASGYDGNMLQRFDANISPAIALPGGTNWLSVIALHPTTDQWLWARSAMGASALRSRALSRGPQWKLGTSQGLTAFAIHGVLQNENKP